MTIPNPDPTPSQFPFLVQLRDIVLGAATVCAAVTVTVIAVLVVNYLLERAEAATTFCHSGSRAV